MNCHICSQSPSKFVDEKTEMVYYHCAECEYIFKSPEIYQDFARQKERYNLHENFEEDAGYHAYFQRFLDFILPYVGEVKSALDFGCGHTSLLAQLLEKKSIVCGYYDPIYYPKNWEDTKYYDLIVSTEVFEHLHQPRDIFKMLTERVKEGGFLAIQTQFHSNDVTAFKRWYYHRDPTHIVFFTPKTFSVLCRQYGCHVVADNKKNIIVMQKGKIDAK